MHPKPLPRSETARRDWLRKALNVWQRDKLEEDEPVISAHTRWSTARDPKWHRDQLGPQGQEYNCVPTHFNYLAKAPWRKAGPWDQAGTPEPEATRPKVARPPVAAPPPEVAAVVQQLDNQEHERLMFQRAQALRERFRREGVPAAQIEGRIMLELAS